MKDNILAKARSLRTEVTARGLHLTSEELRIRLVVASLSPDDRAHIFSAATATSGDLLIVADKC